MTERLYCLDCGAEPEGECLECGALLCLGCGRDHICETPEDDSAEFEPRG